MNWTTHRCTTTRLKTLLAEQNYFYRPQTKFAKVMFLHLSVNHSVHRGGLQARVLRGLAWGGVQAHTQEGC